ncbi:hypothetical protein MTF69_38770 [Streptomyces sp. AP-93]|nr:hypothetical protein [Streptomyces sp. AP-93]
MGPGGHEGVELYERRAHGLVHRATVELACFVPPYDAHGYDQR